MIKYPPPPPTPRSLYSALVPTPSVALVLLFLNYTINYFVKAKKIVTESRVYCVIDLQVICSALLHFFCFFNLAHVLLW